MQQRHIMLAVYITMQCTSIFGMQQAIPLSLHRQAEQKHEEEIKSLDDAPERTIKLIAQDGQTIEVAESYLKSSNYFQKVLEDKDATKIPLCTITHGTSSDPDEVSLRALTDILKMSCVSQHNSLSDAIAHSSDKRLLKLYYIAIYFDIQKLRETLEPSVVKILFAKAHLPEYMQILQAWDPAWQKRLAKIALANNRDVLDFYNDNIAPEESFSEKRTGEVSLATTSENIVYCVNSKLTLWKHGQGKVDSTALGVDPRSMSFSPDGKSLLIVKNGIMILPINEHGRFKTFDLKIMHFDLVKNVSWSPDSKQIIFVNQNDTHLYQVYLYDLALDVIEEQKYSYGVAAIAFSPCNPELAIIDKNGTLRIIDQKTNDIHSVSLGASDDLYDKIAWSPDGTKIACYSTDRVAQTSNFDRENGKVSQITPHKKIHTIAWSPNGDYLALCDASGNTIIWDVNEQVPVLNLIKEHQGIAWQTSQKLVAVRKSSDYSDYIFDVLNIDLELTLPQVSLIKEVVRQKNPAIAFQYPQIYGSLPQNWKNALQGDFKKHAFSERWHLKFKALSSTKKKYVLAILGIAAAGLAYGSKLLWKQYGPTSYDILTSRNFGLAMVYTTIGFVAASF